jgi:hypothetical protein
MIRLYETLLRPHVEYSAFIWSPYDVKDKELIGRLQHRFTKLIPEVKDLSYCVRLHKLGLWTLAERRNIADLVEVYKMVKDISALSFETFFKLQMAELVVNLLKFKNRFFHQFDSTSSLKES